MQALEALAYAHGRGVVHGDIKRSNILVAPDDNVKLTDFGIASRSGDPRLTGEGVALGSLFYMSPEQMKAEAVDARSDLYSWVRLCTRWSQGSLQSRAPAFTASSRLTLKESHVLQLSWLRICPRIFPVSSRSPSKSYRRPDFRALVNFKPD